MLREIEDPTYTHTLTPLDFEVFCPRSLSLLQPEPIIEDVPHSADAVTANSYFP
jgi:hypothetical protein